MNLQQLEYIVAVDDCRHFVKASEKCFFTRAFNLCHLRNKGKELHQLDFAIASIETLKDMSTKKIILVIL